MNGGILAGMKAPPQPPLESAPDFGELLGKLLLVLRDGAAKKDKIRRALHAAAARVAHTPAIIEAGIVRSDWGEGGDPLKERLQVRQIDAIQVAAGAPERDLLALAQALTEDGAPIPESSHIQVRLFPTQIKAFAPAPAVPVPAAPAAALSGSTRDRSDEKLAEVIHGVLREIELAIRQEQWHTVLHDAQAVLRMLPGLGEASRRTYAIGLRRQLTRPVIAALISQGYRVVEEQKRTAEVLRAGGIEAAERMVEELRQNDSIGPRAFLADALAGMPEALPVIAPLVQSDRTAEARLGAELLGRLGVPDAIPLLGTLVQHQDERVRMAAVEGLARYRDKSAVEPLRQALVHESASMRARAAKALAARGSGAIAMPLLAALEAEREPGTWEELLGALAGIDAPEAAAALSRIALERGGLFARRNLRVRRQLAVVRALSSANTTAAKQALARIAAEGQGEVKVAAGEALGVGG